MIVLTVPGDPLADDVSPSGEWSADTLLAADEAHKRVVFAEPDLAKCERILARWEAYAKAPAARLCRATDHGHEATEETR